MHKPPSKPVPLASIAALPPAGTAAFDDAVAAEVNRQLAARGIDLPADLKSSRLIDAPTAAAMLGYSLAHFRRLYRAGKIAAPVRLNGRKVGWPASVLQSMVTAHQTAA